MIRLGSSEATSWRWNWIFRIWVFKQLFAKKKVEMFMKMLSWLFLLEIASLRHLFTEFLPLESDSTGKPVHPMLSWEISNSKTNMAHVWRTGTLNIHMFFWFLCVCWQVNFIPTIALVSWSTGQGTVDGELKITRFVDSSGPYGLLSFVGDINIESIHIVVFIFVYLLIYGFLWTESVSRLLITILDYM